MIRKKDAKKKIHLNRRSFIIAAILFVVLFLFIFADRGTWKFYQDYRERNALQQEIELLKQKRDRLQKEKDKLEHDMQYIEKIAREKYHMRKKDEKVYKVEIQP